MHGSQDDPISPHPVSFASRVSNKDHHKSKVPPFQEHYLFFQHRPDFPVSDSFIASLLRSQPSPPRPVAASVVAPCTSSPLPRVASQHTVRQLLSMCTSRAAQASRDAIDQSTPTLRAQPLQNTSALSRESACSRPIGGRGVPLALKSDCGASTSFSAHNTQNPTPRCGHVQGLPGWRCRE